MKNIFSFAWRKYIFSPKYVHFCVLVCISIFPDIKVHFSSGFRGIRDMALSRLCMALKNFQEKIKAAKPSRMALTIGQCSGHKWRYVHERYGDLPPLYVAASLTSSFLQHSTCTSIWNQTMKYFWRWFEYISAKLQVYWREENFQ